MPVIGDPETVNNTYIEQIVSSAKAAIDKADELGVIDRKRRGRWRPQLRVFPQVNDQSLNLLLFQTLEERCDIA